jgi:hypothetical protein
MLTTNEYGAINRAATHEGAIRAAKQRVRRFLAQSAQAGFVLVARPLTGRAPPPRARLIDKARYSFHKFLLDLLLQHCYRKKALF